MVESVLYHFLRHTASASATVGFPSLREIEAPSIATQVLPLQVDTIRTWVFPSMVFNCTGNITRWIFRAEETGNNNTVLPRMSTWRRDTHRTRLVQFRRISQSGSADELTGNGPVYEYVLQEPVEVQEGDVLGIELIQMGAEELKFEFLDLGNGSAPLSYHRTFLLEIIRFPPARQDVIWDWQYVPLITAVIGKYLTLLTHHREACACTHTLLSMQGFQNQLQPSHQPHQPHQLFKPHRQCHKRILWFLLQFLLQFLPHSMMSKLAYQCLPSSSSALLYHQH